MNTYIFTGIIYPKRVNFTLKGLPEIEFKHSDFPIEGKLKFNINNCQVRIKFTTTSVINITTDPNINTLKNIIEDLVRSFIDIYCFTYSYSYDLDIRKVVCGKLKINHTFSVQGEYNIKGNGNDFIKLCNIFLTGKHPFLSYVFSDFRRAIKYPAMTAGFCFRAIETLRQGYFEDSNITDDDKRRKAGWEKLNLDMRFKKEDHRLITEKGVLNRHGMYPAITYKEREEIMNHTRKIIERFLNLNILK